MWSREETLQRAAATPEGETGTRITGGEELRKEMLGEDQTSPRRKSCSPGLALCGRLVILLLCL